ncbi:MAG: MerR family transcriptional regulator, partial [Chloroflexi bacterium]|nr:MerR family transcriptional regulator [Chloroflexota bacterium]
MTSSGNKEIPESSSLSMIPSPDSPTLAVGELSNRTGVTTATINYYVRIGVLPPPRKTSPTRALYPADFENRINKIKELQA